MSSINLRPGRAQQAAHTDQPGGAAATLTAGQLLGGAPPSPQREAASSPPTGEPLSVSRRAPLGIVLQHAVLLLGAPLALIVALPIALVNWCVFRDPRQILFSQERVGLRGQPFRILKFRTMREVPGAHFDSWGAGREQLRVTRFGRFLRNSHLDELPQLLNVLRGEMRLIGPRPEMLEIEAWAESEIEGFGQRLGIAPGITGYAQVVQGYTGRNVEAYAEKHALAMAYLARRSLAIDAWILWRTALTMLRLEGWRWNERLSGTRDERAAGGRLLRHPLDDRG